MHPEPNAAVQDGLLGEFDVGAAVEQKRELRGFSLGVSEKFEDCKPHERWVSHSHRNAVFPLLCQTFPFCTSLSHLSGPAAFIPWTLKVNFFPIYPQNFHISNPGITFMPLSLLIY